MGKIVHSILSYYHMGFNIYLHDKGQFWPGLEMGECSSIVFGLIYRHTTNIVEIKLFRCVNISRIYHGDDSVSILAKWPNLPKAGAKDSFPNDILKLFKKTPS